MKGIVVGINLKRGLIAVDVDGDYTIVELLGGYDVNVGDAITGNLHNLGGEILINRTSGEKMDTFIQDYGCTRRRAEGLMK